MQRSLSYTHFYPRSPCGERPCTAETDITLIGFLSTLSLRRATSVRPHTRRRDAISIHALLAESDRSKTLSRQCPSRFLSTLSLRRATVTRSPAPARTQPHFYPRSPCGERQDQNWASSSGPLFLSTLSLRRATSSQPTAVICQCDFYPRSPCGERLSLILTTM